MGEYKSLMEECWAQSPSARPTLYDVKRKMDIIDPKKGELIDNIVNMLEEYSGNLEQIVIRRTKQLTLEVQRTEDLVGRLLPPSVAENLKLGNPVEPENFEQTTIFYSDLVGFTTIARNSTPYQVIGLLNQMYTMFDGIAAKYDVYKVETIGDAYMIVSGLPDRNGDKHAGEISSTALELLCAMGKFIVPHMPEEKLLLRAGIHTGLVCAGVVGIKMPRYCLFGDSTDIASSMESGGKPSRIQVSSTTKETLDRLGGYHCEFRDTIEVEKFGTLGRYFLNGKDGFAGELPPYDI